MGLVKPRAEDPPPIRRAKVRRWPGVLAAVAARKGEWVVVGEYKTRPSASACANVVRGLYDPAGRFEFTARKVNGKGVLYARLKTPQTR